MRTSSPTAKDTARVSRRRFLGGAAALGGATIIPRYILGGAGYAAPSEKLNIAVIGTGGRGKNLIESVIRYEDVQVVAICDVTEREDYSRFYYRGVSGRLPVLRLVTEHYAERKARGEYGSCGEYVDFRKLLEKEKAVDAVMVATPDHTHAVVSLAAIRLGKHVYCEKPLTHSVEEARKVTEEARRAGVATQMGNQGNSSEGIRLVCEWVWDGAIGDVEEVYAWSQTGYWNEGLTERPRETPPVPDGLDWDLWLGPAAHRPYHPAYVPYNWRGWWDFGTGAIGDMGCHNIDPAFAALKLRYPATVEACSTRLSSETTPDGTIATFMFPRRGSLPPVKLTWYDGGLFPPRPEELPREEKLDGNGVLLVGSRGKILCGGWSRDPRLIPASRMKEYKQPPKTIPRVSAHDRAWIDAAKGGPPASSNFDVAGPLTELVLLANVALRTGQKIWWDGEAMKAENVPEADRFLRPPCREGWSL